MAIIRTIGKNTIGDNKKMKVAMHDYEMSSHDLSAVFRSSMAPGVLVPFMKLPAQKGDIWDIQLTNKTLTHPTLGPLFGAFKLQHFIFSCPIRLYNSWLHNNRVGIGMKMSQIKLPGYNVGSGTTNNAFNQSSLIAYTGIRGTRRSSSTTNERYNAIPILAYLDIFKNYFANTQEENFYFVNGLTTPPTMLYWGLTGFPIPTNREDLSITISSTSTLRAGTGNPNTELSTTTTTWSTWWSQVYLTYSSGVNTQTVSAASLSSDTTNSIITLDKIPANSTLKGINVTKEAIEANFKPEKIGLGTEKLETIDQLRDLILQTPGNTELILNDVQTGAKKLPYQMISARHKNLGGLLLKTYDSDVFQNWVKTDWIDGENGISAITAVAVQDGVITIDALNLQQKVYNMLNRIAISGGTYRDWLETVYTSGQYMERPETPVFEGGMSQIIEFEEVISKSATDNQPLGDLAGRGVSSRPNGSGKLHFKVTEPSYIMGIVAITPMIDYSQGNDWDIENIHTMDDWHKPALDGIGYEDSMNVTRAWWTKNKSTGVDSSAGKTVAWINYMTNFNRTFGNFASGESESFMCLNRNYEKNYNGTEITDLTTYIDPAKHNEIFADTDRGAQNFWVQTAMDIKVRRNISAKQIPNI